MARVRGSNVRRTMSTRSSVRQSGALTRAGPRTRGGAITRAGPRTRDGPRARGGRGQLHGKDSLPLPDDVEVHQPGQAETIEQGCDVRVQVETIGADLVEETSPDNAMPLAQIFPVRLTRRRKPRDIVNAEASCHEATMQTEIDQGRDKGEEGKDHDTGSQSNEGEDPIANESGGRVEGETNEGVRDVIQTEPQVSIEADPVHGVRDVGLQDELETNDGGGDVGASGVHVRDEAELVEGSHGGRGLVRGRGRGSRGRGRGRRGGGRRGGGRRGGGRRSVQPAPQTEDMDTEDGVGTSSHSSEESSESEASTDPPPCTDAVDDVGVVEKIGPQDCSVLKHFSSHVAHSIAQGHQGPILKLHHHASLLNKWVIDDQAEPRFRSRVMESGLFPLAGLGHYTWMKHRRVSAFVERWYPETNSFHFQFGEMTLTLDDVVQLTGLPATGAPLFVEDDREPIALVVQFLGVTAAEAKRAVGDRRSVPLDWLRTTFSRVDEDDDDSRVDCCARAYLLYILGCTVLTNKEGSRVRVNVLPFLSDLDGVRGYAWGAAALAILYRELGWASRKDGRQIAGFLTLLETWIDEHFPSLNPVVDPNYTEDLPRARRWCARKESGHDQFYYRHLLDDMAPDQVIFDPYSQRRQAVPPIAFYTGPIRAMAVIEPHLPDRVLRQFGLLQVIPSQAIAPARDQTPGRHLSKKRKYDVKHCWIEGFWDSPEYHSVPQAKRIRPTVPWSCSSEYQQWFKRVSHPRVDISRGPVRRLREEQIAGVVHMAEKALEGGRDQWRPALEKVVHLLGSPSESAIADGQQRRARRAGSVGW